MTERNWLCLACEKANPWESKNCSSCGCPAEATSIDVDAYKAKVKAMGSKPYSCVKCQHNACTSGELRGSGGILSSLIEVESEKFSFISCARCGYTEFYRGPRNALRNIIDFGI